VSYDASDPKQVKDRIKQLRVQENIKDDLLRRIMETREGRSWFFEILESAHIWRSSFSVEALAMGFAEGERNMGLRLLADLMRACPARYIEMVQEARELGDLEKSIKQTGEGNDGSDSYTDDTSSGT
jgi:hypothetical protein